MKHSLKWGAGLMAAASLSLAGCSGGTPSTSATTSQEQKPVTLTMAAWLLDSTPEFKTLADAFHAANPNITIELKEYVAGNDYDTQMIADLAAGSAPDLYIIKNLKNFFTYQDGGQLMDVVRRRMLGSTTTRRVCPTTSLTGRPAAIPYRQDSWYLYYDKDMFDQAGVAYPDGKWTWDDYAAAADTLSKAFPADDVFGAYMHRWQSCVQGFASAQTPGSDILSGNFDYMKPFYDRVVSMQDKGDQVSFNTSSTNSLSYQSQFGQQKAAMLIMGSWYVGAYLTQVGYGRCHRVQLGHRTGAADELGDVQQPGDLR